MRQFLAWFFWGFAPTAVLVLVVVGVAAVPQCPTEDSCTIDYRDGSWHVTEVTP